MTDFELNKAIAETLGLSIKCLHDVVMTEEREELGFHSETDYCTDWGDLMPLVVEHEISIDYFDEGLSAMTANDKGVYHVVNESPQRALAECLLKVIQNGG